jgi:hypothetical protein
VLRDPVVPGTKGTGLLDPCQYAQIAPATGYIVRSNTVGVGALYDTLQMAGTITLDGTHLQGALTGALHITAQ